MCIRRIEPTPLSTRDLGRGHRAVGASQAGCPERARPSAQRSRVVDDGRSRCHASDARQQPAPAAIVRPGFHRTEAPPVKFCIICHPASRRMDCSEQRILPTVDRSRGLRPQKKLEARCSSLSCPLQSVSPLIQDPPDRSQAHLFDVEGDGFLKAWAISGLTVARGLLFLLSVQAAEASTPRKAAMGLRCRALGLCGLL